MNYALILGAGEYITLMPYYSRLLVFLGGCRVKIGVQWLQNRQPAKRHRTQIGNQGLADDLQCFLRCLALIFLIFPATGYSQATVYEHSNFAGRSKALKVGKYTPHDLQGFNDLISSVKVAEGYRVVVYTDGNAFGGYGKRRVFEMDYTDLTPVEINDAISYIEVSVLKDSAVASVFEHYHFQGRRRDLRVGDVVFYCDEDMNNWISSVKVQPGYALIAWDGASEDAVSVFKGTGGHLFLEYDVADLTTFSMNDRISFITVTPIPKPFANGGCRGAVFDFLAPHFSDKWIPGNEIVLNYTTVNSSIHATGFAPEIRMPLNNLLVANDSTLRGSGRVMFSDRMMPVAGGKAAHFNPYQAFSYEFSINVCTNQLSYTMPEWGHIKTASYMTSQSGLLYDIGIIDMNVFTFISCGPP